MSLPGTVPLPGLTGPPSGDGGGGGGAFTEQKMVQYMQAFMESCPTKTVMAGGMGFALGGMFGMFMSSMRYDTPLTQQSQELSSLPIRQQLRTGLRDMGKASLSSAKNFGIVGAVFSGVECCIEGYRAKNDLSNGIAAGCITGGILARNGGPSAVALGCAGFAAFSAAIDSYMRMPGEAATGGPIE